MRSIPPAQPMPGVLGGEFERGVAVVIEAAHETRIDDVADAERVQPAGDGSEEVARGGREMVRIERRIGNDAAVAFIL